MAAATKDVARAFESGVEPVFNDHALTASATIYEGQVVTLGATTNTAGTFASTDTFAGFAMTKAVQADGATHAHVRAQGAIKLTIAIAASVDVGDTVYASDNNTFDDVSSGGLAVGRVHRIESETASTAVVIVSFQAASLRSLA
tara:strand:+ start:1365 stop:1796 length:432 start_codon:yes stop_codon:yes gene_type:complete